MDFFINWFDLIWLPLVFLLAARRHWVKAVLLVLSCVLALRLQVELLAAIGYPHGLLPLWDWPALYRGYVVYGLFIATFLFLSFYAKRENNYVYLAAAITCFIAAFCVSTVAMVI